MKMKNLVRRGLNIIGHLSFKRIIFSSIIISIFAIGYFPFYTLNMMRHDEWWTLNRYISEYYEKTYLIKGRSFNATSHDGERFTVHLGWDDCVYIKKGEIKKKILVNKMFEVEWSNRVYHYFEGFITIEKQDRDTTFLGVAFCDIKDSVILYIYKQPDGLPYGRQKYGFDVNIENWKFKSGRDNYFDY